MMMSESESVAPAQDIRNSYRQALQARREYRRLMGSELEGAAHEGLHEAVFDLYEVLRPMIKEANATEDQWVNEELWPVSRKYIDAACCPNCDHVEQLEQFDDGDRCPNCNRATMEVDEVPAVDEHGDPAYVWEQGLRTLDGLRNRTQTRTVEHDDALGTYETEVSERQLLEPEKLIVVADILDECMQQLDLLVSFDDDLPTGQLSGVDPK